MQQQHSKKGLKAGVLATDAGAKHRAQNSINLRRTQREEGAQKRRSVCDNAPSASTTTTPAEAVDVKYLSTYAAGAYGGADEGVAAESPRARHAPRPPSRGLCGHPMPRCAPRARPANFRPGPH